MMITALFRRLLFVSHEWGPPIAIGSFDVKTAFGLMNHEVVYDALRSLGIPGDESVALINELRCLQAEVEVPGVASAAGIGVNKSVQQGGTETTALWDLLMEHLLADSWAREGLGFKLDDANRESHVVFTDNI